MEMSGLLKTDSRSYIPFLNPNYDYIYLLEHLELAMTTEQLDRVVEKHNAGMDYRLIAKQERRNPVEIIIALLHQLTVSQKDHNRSSVRVKRPFARLIK